MSYCTGDGVSNSIMKYYIGAWKSFVEMGERILLYIPSILLHRLTLKLLTTTIVAPPINASKWQMGFNSAFKGLILRNSDLNYVSIDKR